MNVCELNVEWCECNVKAYELVLLLEHVRAKECWLLLFITTTTLFTMSSPTKKYSIYGTD